MFRARPFDSSFSSPYFRITFLLPPISLPCGPTLPPRLVSSFMRTKNSSIARTLTLYYPNGSRRARPNRSSARPDWTEIHG